MGAALTQLIPIQELTPGAVGAIRNQVINSVVALASSELGLAPEKLVVRDVRPFSDLQLYAGGTTDSTLDQWLYDATTTTAAAFTAINGSKTMGDQRYVALFGIRDLRRGLGIHTTGMATGDTAVGLAAIPEHAKPAAVVSLVKINVGGADKVIWDLTSIEAYPEQQIGFTPSAVIIPQNASFVISYYFKTTIAGIRANLQLIGVAVEPRGKVISP